MRAEDPEGVERGAVAMEWGSDALAELLSRLDLRYLALVPGSSYRGLHDSLVNYAGNRDPRLALAQLTPAERQVQAASIQGDRQTLTVDAAIPAMMALIYLGLLLYFRSIGGYKTVHLEGTET